MSKTAIIVLNTSGLDTALHIRSAIPQSEIWGLRKRVSNADRSFNDISATLPALLAKGYTIIGICAAGILIRILAPALNNKRNEPPVLAISEDGETIVPLIGGLTGGNELALHLAKTLKAYAAITGSGARKFGIALESPPEGYILANPSNAKEFTSHLLSGTKTRVDGKAPWLETSGLKPHAEGKLTIKITWKDQSPPDNGLLYYPCCVAVGLRHPENFSTETLLSDLQQYNIAPKAVATLLLPAHHNAQFIRAALKEVSDNPFSFSQDKTIRYADSTTINQAVMQETLTQSWASCEEIIETEDFIIAISSAPIDVERFGRQAGSLNIIGIGPGSLGKMTLESHDCLMECSDWVGYETYLNLLADMKTGKTLHASGNRVEADRAREALDLAAEGKKVALVTSGDPGIFAMASAVMEVLEHTKPITIDDLEHHDTILTNAWPEVTVSILPGISAMQTASSKAGAMLGHDFCTISLSDIRKPWEIIEKRLLAALNSDMVIALYNPASKTRREQIEQAISLIRDKRNANTPVLLGKNLERENEELHIITLGELDLSVIDMRTILLFGSSRSRIISWPNQTPFVYTPRSYSLSDNN